MKKEKKSDQEERRDSPRFDVPIFVKDAKGEYQERYGRMGINGFYFETEVAPLIGQVVEVKILLHGLGMEIQTRGRVIGVVPSASFVKVAARFEEIPFETERMIARWLDLLNIAHRAPVAA
jgi:hypothetical protein